MLGGRSRRLFDFLKHTPLHPQWLIFRNEENQLNTIAGRLTGIILDVGCGHQQLRKYLTTKVEYIGLDYYQTATEWYHSRPQIFGDAQQLPVADACFDHIILFDVLEHLPYPGNCLKEIYRALKAGGCLMLQTPFLYPIHDAPRDFQRWTLYGLHQLARDHGFVIAEERPLLKPLENAALVANLGIAKCLIDSLHNKVWLLPAMFTLPLIVVINFFGWLASLIGSDDPFMAHGYRMTWKKPGG